MLFTGCNVLAGEGTLIIKAFHKGKHHCCILIHGPVGSDSVINAECSQQDCCGDCDSELVNSLSDFMFIHYRKIKFHDVSLFSVLNVQVNLPFCINILSNN